MAKEKNETKREKFVRLAEARTNKIIEMLKLLGNCSNTGSYEYNEEDIKKIFGEIEKEIKNARARFVSTDTTNKKFKL
jgi:hypothetical protein